MEDEEELEDGSLCFQAGVDASAIMGLRTSGSGAGESRMSTDIWA